MDMDDIVERVCSWEGVLALRPGPGDGSPEISWGDVFFYLAPDGKVPSGQPFATIVTKDYPGEPSSGLDRPGSFRVNIAARRRGQLPAPNAEEAVNPTAPDMLMPHPVYADLGWVAVVDPGERTREQVWALLLAAHDAALARWQRRHQQPGLLAMSRPERPDETAACQTATPALDPELAFGRERHRRRSWSSTRAAGRGNYSLAARSEDARHAWRSLTISPRRPLDRSPGPKGPDAFSPTGGS